MRHINSVYTIKYNKLEKKDGALFRGRYKSKLVESDGYGIHLVRYIHLNPFEAGMVKRIEDYKWSSFSSYLGLVTKPPWLCFSYTLAHFSEKNFGAEFLEFTYAGNPEFIKRYYSSECKQSIIGSEAFIGKMKAEIAYSSVSDEIPERKILRPSLDKIINGVSFVFKVNVSSIKMSKRGITNNARSMAMLVANKYFGYKLAEISNYFGISSYQAVSKSSLSLSRKIVGDSALNSLLIKILARLENDLTA